MGIWGPRENGNLCGPHMILASFADWVVTSYISSHSSTTATVSSWVHLILSSNLSRKFKTLLQDLFSWHPATSTQHLSWKNCAGFPLQNIWNINSLVCVSVLWMVLVLLTFLNCYMSSLCLIHYTLLLTPACWKSSNTNTRVMAFVLSLALNPTFGIHSHKTLDTAQLCHLLKPNWKPSSSHSISTPTSIISIPSFCYRHCVCVWGGGGGGGAYNTWCKLSW